MDLLSCKLLQTIINLINLKAGLTRRIQTNRHLKTTQHIQIMFTYLFVIISFHKPVGSVMNPDIDPAGYEYFIFGSST